MKELQLLSLSDLKSIEGGNQQSYETGIMLGDSIKKTLVLKALIDLLRLL